MKDGGKPHADVRGETIDALRERLKDEYASTFAGRRDDYQSSELTEGDLPPSLQRRARSDDREPVTRAGERRLEGSAAPDLPPEPEPAPPEPHPADRPPMPSAPAPNPAGREPPSGTGIPREPRPTGEPYAPPKLPPRSDTSQPSAMPAQPSSDVPPLTVPSDRPETAGGDQLAEPQSGQPLDRLRQRIDTERDSLFTYLSPKPRNDKPDKLFNRLKKREKDVDDPAGAPALPATIYISSFFINLLGLALPMVILQVYDRILPNQATATLSLLIAGLVGVLILDTAMKIARAYLVGWTTAYHEYGVFTEAVRRLLDTPSRVVEGTSPSVHIDRFNALDIMREFYGGQSRLLLLDLPFVLVFLALIAFVGGYLVFVPIVLFLTLGSITITRGIALRKILKSRAQNDDRRYDFIIESLTGIHTLKTMAMEPQFQRRFERLQKIGATASHDTIHLSNIAQIVGNLFSSLTMICTVTVGAYMVIHGSLTMGSLAACTLLSGRTIQPLLKGLGLWTQIQSISVARERVSKLFEQEAPEESKAEALEKLDGAISIKGLSFGYGPDAPLVLKNINLEVAPGEMIGLRGGDGSGKSTLIKLLRGEFEPTAGTVRLDDHAPSGVQRSSLAELTAYVPQQPSIIQGTILQNITMYRGGDAIDAAREAAQSIGLEPDIHRLPSGYDTVLSEGIAEDLPAGMMQRIVIARALARKPKLLLFDEGNSSLDAGSDAHLREGLEKLKGQTTVILVSLRPSLLRMATNVYSLQDGMLYNVTAEYADESAAQAAPPMPQVLDAS